MKNKEKFAKEIADITIEGYYVALKDGKPARCECINCNNFEFNTGEKCDTVKEYWAEAEYAEKPEVEWSKVQVDTPILVKEFKEEKWHKRYFAKYEDGKVYTWYKGATSWSTDNSGLITYWETAKLAEQEEERIEKSDTEKEQLELAECVSKIRTYCLSRNECEGCMFRKDEGFFVNCAIDNNPSKWEVQRGRI